MLSTSLQVLPQTLPQVLQLWKGVPVVVIDEREDAGMVWLGPGGSQADWGGT